MIRTQHSRLIVLGAGPAGYTAGIYASRAMLDPMIISGNQPGGQLMITTDVENFPGFAAPIQGPWLVEQMERQAVALGARVKCDLIVEADLATRPIALQGDSGTTYTCDALIVATGAQARWLGLPSELRFQGFGVSACATCDGPFYKGQTVIVVGGGNTAAEEALFLANIAERVIVVHRGSKLRADRVMQERLFAHPKVTMRWDSVPTEIHGTGDPVAVTGVAVENVQTSAREIIAASGVFVSIGHTPATKIFAGQLAMKSGGYLRTTPGSTATSVPGVFAAGDVADDIYRQAVTAAGLGCMAALDAERFLADLQLKQAV